MADLALAETLEMLGMSTDEGELQTHFELAIVPQSHHDLTRNLVCKKISKANQIRTSIEVVLELPVRVKPKAPCERPVKNQPCSSRVS